jgi:peptidoglycan/LPS O-acetylase OafA/YrhL
MLGTFRFILAWFVMLSHLPFSPFPIGYNAGVSSVIMFYFISGYLMYFSFSKIEFHGLKKVFFFFLKRIFRLFPLYLIVLFLTILLIKIYYHSNFIPLLNQDLTLKKIFLNSIMILNNYVFPPFQIHSLLPHPLIPPTWSLSTEWHFYLLVPLFFYLLCNNKKMYYLIFVLSLIFELYAFSKAMPNFNSDNFGYRYIFGVLWIFLAGFLFAKEGYSKFLKSIYFMVIIYFLFFNFYFSNHAYVKEITFAVFFLPFVNIIKNLNFKYDYFLGQLSYPIFISHFFIFYFVENVLGITEKFKYFIVVFILLLIFSSILAFVHMKLYPFLVKKTKSLFSHNLF